MTTYTLRIKINSTLKSVKKKKNPEEENNNDKKIMNYDFF